MLDLSNSDVAFAIESVKQTAGVAREVQQELTGESLTKDDRSPVTVADFGVQAIVGCLFERMMPGDALVGEEDASVLRTEDAAETRAKVAEFVGRHLAHATEETVCAWIDRGGGAPASRFWTLDPIDGTKGFLRREQYAIALALIVDGVVQIGVLGCPNLVDAHKQELDGAGSLIAAVRGQGTWTAPLTGEGEWRQLRVSECSDAAEARLLRSVESGHTNVDRMGKVAAELGVHGEPVRMDSQAKYGVLAAGAGEILFRLLSPKQPDYEERIWDQAAGSIVAEEAGGRITDLSGKPLDFSQGRTLAKNRGVLATNGHLHDVALQGLAAT
jgi:3'(2'), 5'-bisphosphate nucleotidase